MFECLLSANQLREMTIKKSDNEQKSELQVIAGKEIVRVEKNTRVRKRRYKGDDRDHPGIFEGTTDDDEQEVGELKTGLDLPADHQ